MFTNMSSSSLPGPKDISTHPLLLGMVTKLDVTKKMQTEVTSVISGQEHLKIREGSSKLLSNAVANQEAT